MALQNFDSIIDPFISIFQSSFNLAFQKFSVHFVNHPSRSLFRATRIFNPRFPKLTIANRDIQRYVTSIPELSNPSNELIQEWGFYCDYELSTVDYNRLDIFWEKVKLIFPLLSEIAFNYIWLPISSCSVERGFSVYNNILQDNRHNLSLESLKMLNMMYFNRTDK